MDARDTNARRSERETVADRSRVGISNRKTRRSISVILIRKYNDRRSRLAAGAGRDRVNKRKRKMEGKGVEGSDGVACERRLPRICYGPIAIVTPIYEFHCDTAAHPFGWLRCLDCNVYVNAYTTCTCLLCTSSKV